MSPCRAFRAALALTQWLGAAAGQLIWIGRDKLAAGARAIVQYNGPVPELSRFFGIIIRMFAERVHHITLLISTRTIQDEFAIFSIDPVEMIAGSLPTRQKRLVEAWAELHEAELRADWGRLQEGRRPVPIEPLR